jgi:tetratricopeptide (TPR) repeat protein
MDLRKDPNLSKDPDLAKLATSDLKAIAIDAFTSAVRLNNAYTNAYNLRGLAYLEAGQMEKALEDFDQAIALDPRLASAYLNRGIVYNTRSMFARAIEDFKANFLLDPIERYELWLGWGTALIATKQFPDAIEKLTRAVRLAPKADGAAYEKRGYANQLLDPPRLEAARVDLLTAIERDDRLLNAYDYLGLVETQMNRPQEAIRYYKAALEKDPCRTITLNNLGKAYLRLENYQDAERAFRDTIEYAKEDSIEHQEASRLLEFIGQKKADLDGEEK